MELAIFKILEVFPASITLQKNIYIDIKSNIILLRLVLKIKNRNINIIETKLFWKFIFLKNKKYTYIIYFKYKNIMNLFIIKYKRKKYIY